MPDVPSHQKDRGRMDKEDQLGASFPSKDVTGYESQDLLQIAVKASLIAGEAILRVYESEDFGLEIKTDKSPLTRADQDAHHKIMDVLSQTGIPVLSEEGVQEDYAQRRHWELLWIIDPLDGTKEFIKRNGEFTVNIALIYKSQPVLGVVFLPVTGLVYMAASRLGAFRCKRPDQLSFEMADLLEQAQPLPCHEQSNAHQLTVVGSRSHQTPELEAFVQKLRNKYREVDFIAAGSSLKICRVAEGSADIYPRLGPTMEWDTAAGQAIAEQAGLSVLVWETGLALRYNREDLKNPWFVVVDAKTYMETKELYT